MEGTEKIKANRLIITFQPTQTLTP